MPPESTQTADVSVIIPAYRAEASIGRALASVAAQTCKPREVIVVDDGSDDGTLGAAEAMGERMNGIVFKVITQENRGAGAARNRALEHATSTYVAFLDADDEWLAEKMARSMAAIEKGGLVLVAHDFHRRDQDGAQTMVHCARHFKATTNPYRRLYKTGYIGTLTVVARLDAVRAAGGFDESLAAAQDFDLWLKMLAPADARFSVFDEALAIYYPGAAGITAKTDQRLACSRRVAGRHAPSLPAYFMRIMAVHYEAILAYLYQGRPGKALWTFLQAPFAAVFNVPPGRAVGRRS